MLKKILGGLSGPPGALHDSIRALPIRVDASILSGGTLVKKYFISGKLRTVLYLSAQTGEPEAPRGSSINSSNTSESDEESETVNQQGVTPELCSDTDSWNVYWEGDCATQQESEDAEAVWIAVDAESTDALSDFEDASAQHEWELYCESLTTEEKYAQNCWVSDMLHQESAVPDGDLMGAEWGNTGELASPGCQVVVPGAMESCFAENLSALAQAASWIDGKVGLRRILTSYKPGTRILVATAAEISWATGLTILAGFSLGFSIGAAIQCWAI